MEKTRTYSLENGRLNFYDAKPKIRPALDSFLLSNLLPKNFKGSLLEVGCGMGIPAILIASKNKNAEITGIDIQKSLLEIAKKNTVLNSLENQINFKNISIEDIKKDFDAVITNPPFHKESSPNLEKNIAHHEQIPLQKWIELCLKRVRNNGFFGIVIPTSRLTETLIQLEKNNMGKIVITTFKETKKRITITAIKDNKTPLEIIDQM